MPWQSFWASAWTTPIDVKTMQPPPAAPTNLAGSVRGTQVTLSWTDNSSNETAFEIWRKPAGGNYAFLSYVPANLTRFTDTSASTGATYRYAIRAITPPLGSPFTPEVTVTTGTVAPVAAPDGLSAVALSGSQIKLTWTDHSNNETALEVYRKTGSGSYALVGLLAPKSTSFTDSGLTAGTTYIYRVRAANSLWASAFTNEVSITPGP